MYIPKKGNGLMMGRKVRTAGWVMILIGATMLASMAVFICFGYDFVVKRTIQFEQDQYKNTGKAAESITIPGFKKWNIPAGETMVRSEFYNPEHNECYFVLTVALEEDGTIIYQSDYLKPGQHLYEVELQSALEAGNYEAILQYHTYSMVDFSPMNGAAVPFALVVK